MNNEIKYNVNAFIKKNANDFEDVKKIFNQKLLKVIIALETKSNVCQE